MFLANYGDVLTDAPMNDLIDEFAETDCVAQFLAVPAAGLLPRRRHRRATGTSRGIEPVADMSMCINGGYFVLRQGIFDYLEEGDDLVMDGCVRAAADGGCAPSATRASGPRWTRSRSAPRWRACTGAGSAPGRCGARTRRAAAGRSLPVDAVADGVTSLRWSDA